MQRKAASPARWKRRYCSHHRRWWKWSSDRDWRGRLPGGGGGADNWMVLLERKMTTTVEFGCGNAEEGGDSGDGGDDL